MENDGQTFFDATNFLLRESVGQRNERRDHTNKEMNGGWTIKENKQEKGKKEREKKVHRDERESENENGDMQVVAKWNGQKKTRTEGEKRGGGGDGCGRVEAGIRSYCWAMGSCISVMEKSWMVLGIVKSTFPSSMLPSSTRTPSMRGMRQKKKLLSHVTKHQMHGGYGHEWKNKCQGLLSKSCIGVYEGKGLMRTKKKNKGKDADGEEPIW